MAKRPKPPRLKNFAGGKPLHAIAPTVGPIVGGNKPKPPAVGPGGGNKPLPIDDPTAAKPTPEPGPRPYENPPPLWWEGAAAFEVFGLPTLVWDRTQPEPQDFTLHGSADGRPVPIAYGRVMIQPKFLYGPYAFGSTLISTWSCSVGPIEGFEEIRLTGGEGSQWDDGAHGTSKAVKYPNTADWCTLVQWHGLAAQPADPAIVVFDPAYTDTNVYSLRGLTVPMSYLTILQTAHGASEVSAPTVIEKGLQVFDQRLSGGAGGTAYSTNPALWLADFTSKPYGANETVDWDSFSALADRADESIGGAPRWWGGALLSEDAGVERHMDRLRALAHCSLRVQGSTFYAVPYAPRAKVFDFTTANIVADSMEVSYEDTQNQPTRVEVQWTATKDTGGAAIFPWQTRTAIYDTGVQPGTTSVVSLLDAQSHEVAYRYARDQQREKAFAPWKARFRSMDMVADLTEGDRVGITHPDFDGLVDMFLERIQSARDGMRIVFNLECREYDPANFSDDDVADTTFAIGNVGDPTAPPALSGVLTAEEDIGPDQGVVKSRILVRFPADGFAYVKHYAVVVEGPGQRIEFTASQQPEGTTIQAYSPDLSHLNIPKKGTVFTVSASIVSTVADNEGTPVSVLVTVFGTHAPPPDTTFILSSFDQNTGEIRLAVDPVDDLEGGIRYVFRYSLTAGTKWETALPLHRGYRRTADFVVSGFATEGISGVYVFCKAVDKRGNKSTNAARESVFFDPGTTITVLSSKHLLEAKTEPGNAQQNFYFFTLPGQGEYVMAVDSDHSMVDRFGTGAAWDNRLFPVYEKLPWAAGRFGTLAVRIPFATSRVRQCNYQADVTETTSGIVNLESTNGTDVWPEHFVHRNLDDYRTWITYLADDFPTTDYAAWIKLPITIRARISPVLQTISEATNLNNSPETFTFDKDYSQTPVISQPIVTVSGTNRAIHVSVASGGLTSTGVTWIYDAQSGNGSQPFDIYFTVVGT